MSRFSTSSCATTLLILAGCGGRSYLPANSDRVELTVNPGSVCWTGRNPQYLNFDLLISNGSSEELTVREVRATVFEGNEAVEQRQIAGQAAEALGPNRSVPPSSLGMLFNPLVFNSLKPGTRLRYDVNFDDEASPPVSVTVTPQRCSNQNRLLLPLTGRILVSDGYDLFSHHRLREYLHPFWREFGVSDHADRYALDLVAVDAAGQKFRGSGTRNEDFFSWGERLRAPADGIIAAVRNDHADNTEIGSEHLWTERDLETSEMGGYGNYVLINHGRGEFSLLAHLRAGSVVARRGQQVRAGQIVGQVGNSGSSLGPHLHYELRNGWGLRGITSMPPYFFGLTIAGTGETADAAGLAINSGDIVTAP